MRYRLVQDEPGLFRPEVRRGWGWTCIAGDGHEMQGGMRWSGMRAEAAQAAKVHMILYAGEGRDWGFWRDFALGIAVAYLATGLYLGNALARHIPAMNAAGVAYYAVMWPGFVAAASWGTPAPIVPKWAFSFRGRR